MTNRAVVDAILETLDAAPELIARLEDFVTLERAYRYLSALESAPTPSQTAQWTRVPVVEELLDQEGVLSTGRVVWTRNFEGSGNAVLTIGSNPRRKHVWMLAHLDQISYLVDPGSDGRYPLLPLCYHMQESGTRAAIALRPDLGRGSLAICARGAIEVNGPEVCFVTGDGERLEPGTRVVYASDFNWNPHTDQIQGYLDDTVACTALLLAAGVLHHYSVEVLIGLTDEEEGPPGDANQSFGKGGRRLVRLFDPPELAIVSDVHESEAMVRGPGPRDIRPGDGAVFAERSSNGRGSATPPHLYALEQHLAVALSERGIRLRENWGGYVSRSEDINAAIVTPNIALVGVLCSNRHFAQDRPTANLGDVLDLAKVLVVFTLLAHSGVWSRLTPRGARRDVPH
jgi:putative aminopeptidase FrvX